MSKKRTRKKVEDINEIARRTVEQSTGETLEPPPPEPHQKDPAAVSLGRRGGLKGGRRRAESLTPERRSEIARLGAEKRWRPKKASD